MSGVTVTVTVAPVAFPQAPDAGDEASGGISLLPCPDLVLRAGLVLRADLVLRASDGVGDAECCGGVAAGAGVEWPAPADVGEVAVPQAPASPTTATAATTIAGSR
jgi:hypothetical protein